MIENQCGAGKADGRRFAAGQIDPTASVARWRDGQGRRVAIGRGQQQHAPGAVQGNPLALVIFIQVAEVAALRKGGM